MSLISAPTVEEYICERIRINKSKKGNLDIVFVERTDESE